MKRDSSSSESLHLGAKISSLMSEDEEENVRQRSSKRFEPEIFERRESGFFFPF